MLNSEVLSKFLLIVDEEPGEFSNTLISGLRWHKVFKDEDELRRWAEEQSLKVYKPYTISDLKELTGNPSCKAVIILDHILHLGNTDRYEKLIIELDSRLEKVFFAGRLWSESFIRAIQSLLQL